MSWQDRLQPTIEMTSPDGQTFSAKWSGNARSLEKKLGIFTYPKVNGAILQDLGLGGTQYPLRLSFDGEDNDVEASRFFEAFNSFGTWAVTHPTKGLLTLQPSTVTENVEPVESGSITVFDTVWLQPAPEETAASTAALIAESREQALITDDTALTQLEDTASQASVEEVNALVSSTETTLSLYDTTVGALMDGAGELAAQADAIRRGIADVLSVSPLDLTALGGSIQAIMSLPAQISGDILQTIAPISDFIEELAALPDEVADQTYINTLAIREIFLTSANTTIGKVIVGGAVATRAQALEAADVAAVNFQTITDGLDVAQEQFSALRVDQQYFSQSASFNDSARSTALSVRLLIATLFNLSVEKRFTLTHERAPIEITITEYGDLGENDINFDVFIETNHLKDAEILLLAAGREVVVYV